MKRESSLPVFISSLFAFALLITGCAENREFPTSRLDQAYETGFFVLPPPDVRAVMRNGSASQAFEGSPEHLWQSTIQVTMQRAPIVAASEENGTLFAPPYAIYIAQSPDLRIWVWFMSDLYKQADDPTKDSKKLEPTEVANYVETLVQQIGTQFQASRNLEGGRWSYLKN